ncbi:MAG: glycosyltransferase [Bacteroidales bacterium]|nr:glycosyltransferase [Bacteroidales bacterium]
MKSIHVLEVIRQGKIGGGESHLMDLISGFGPEISPIVLAFTSGYMIDLLRNRGITCYVIETSHAFDFGIFGKIMRILKKEQIQIIHAHGSRASSNMVLLSRIMRIPMIYTVHGWSFHQDQSKFIESLRIFSEKMLCSLSTQVICVSQSNKLTGQKAFGLKNAIVIENGINLQKFNPENEFINIRKEFGFQADDFIIGFIGRITIQKDPITFIKSIESANSTHKEIKGLLVGDGDLKESVLKYIDDHHLNDVIITSGFKTEIPEILNAIDVFCLPSLWEGLSIALLEAMSMKCAVLVTPTDGTNEIIQDDINGTLTDFSNPVMLKNKILQYFNDRELLRIHGENAALLVKNRFDSKQVSLRVTELYQDILLRAH